MLPMRDGQSTSEDRATQLLICEPLSFANTDATILRLFCWSPNSTYLHFGFLFKKQDNLRPTICLCYLSGPLHAVWPTMWACSTVILCLRFPCAHTGALPTSVVLTLVEWFQKIVDPVFSENFANSHGSNVVKVVARTSLVEANGKSHNMVDRGWSMQCTSHMHNADNVDKDLPLPLSI